MLVETTAAVRPSGAARLIDLPSGGVTKPRGGRQQHGRPRWGNEAVGVAFQVLRVGRKQTGRFEKRTQKFKALGPKASSTSIEGIRMIRLKPHIARAPSLQLVP